MGKAVKQWPVDSVMMPVNPIEEIIGGFLTKTLPAAKEKRIAVIGMKILGGGNFIIPEWNITPELLIRYALSQDISVAIVGCSTPGEVQTLSKYGRHLDPLTDSEKSQLLEILDLYAKRMAFYRGVF